MYIEDQDEEVEEEEEFHEVEEDKHKSSQESVGGSIGDRLTTSPKHRTDTSNISKQPQTEIHQKELDLQQDSNAINPHVEAELKNPSQAESMPPPTQNDQPSTINSEIVPLEAEKSELSKQPAKIETGECLSSDIKLEAINSDENSTGDQLDKGVAVETTHMGTEESGQVTATDWANIMLNSESKTPEPDTVEVRDESIVKSENEIDDVIKQTEELNLHDEPPKEDRARPEKVDEQADQTNDAAIDSETNENTTEKTECDGQKADEVEKRELDLDEDEENPQYIPKKGDFYEHDDRSHNVEEDESAKNANDQSETKDTNVIKKSSNQEKQADNRRANRRQRIDNDRWNHDLFRDEKQKPKNNNTHGFENRHHPPRNPIESRTMRNTGATDAPEGSQENRSRQSRDGRNQRQNQLSNRSREGKPRRQNVRNSRNEANQSNHRLRESINKDTRSKPDTKDSKDVCDEKQPTPPTPNVTLFSTQKNDSDHRESKDGRSLRNDSRGRSRTSRDRPINSTEDKLPPPNTVMPPITTWSNEDMVKAEAFSKDSPSRQQSSQHSGTNNQSRNRSNESWSQGQPSKNVYQDRSLRNYDENRQMNYNPRGRYRDRDDSHRSNHSSTGSQFNERSNHNNVEWNRSNNYNSYNKPTDYIVKTQTFENSRLAQANRSNNRDLREMLNESRAQGQQHFQPKSGQGVDSLQVQPANQIKNPNYHQYGQPHFIHQSHLMPQHQAPQHMAQQQLQQHQPLSNSPLQTQQTTPVPPQQQLRSHQPQPNKQASAQLHQQSSSTQAPTGQTYSQHQLHSQRQPLISPQTNQARPNAHLNNVADHQEHARPNAGVSSDPMSSRPIIKTDTYTSTTGVAPPHHQPGSQHMVQHSQRNVGGSLTQQQQQQQQGSNPAGSHMVPSHLSTSSVQTQYYTPSNSARDTATAVALASAYHGYIPGGHTVMDTTARYHMTSQQMSDHGYMTSPGQAGGVAAGPVLHQQGLYADTAAGGTVASSAYLAQAGSNMSPASSIPVTGNGGPQPMPPISYLQHSQYPPPPYSNPYPQHQHNQGPPPPHSGQAYPPYWTYMSQ